MISKRYFAVIAFSAMLVPSVAQAQLLDGLLGGGDSGGGLLDGVLGGGSSDSSLLGVVGGSESGALVTIGDNARYVGRNQPRCGRQ